MKGLFLSTLLGVSIFLLGGGVMSSIFITESRKAYCDRNMHWQTDDPIYKEYGVFICKYCDVRVEIGE